MARGRAALGALLAAALLGAREAESKLQVAKVTLGPSNVDTTVLDPASVSRPWAYAGKFGFGLGKGRYEMRVREVWPKVLPPGTMLNMQTIIDEKWPAAEAEVDDCRRGKHVTRAFHLTLGNTGEWSEWRAGLVTQRVRPHVWYYALTDCGARSLSNATYDFEVEFNFTQEDGSHLSVEEAWAPHARALSLLGLSGFLWSFWRRTHRFKSLNGGLHPVIWALGGAVLAQYAAQGLQLGHLAMFTRDGRGSRALEVLAEVLFMSSQAVQTSLLIAIARGYTLTRADVGRRGVVLPSFLLVALVHAALVVFDEMQDDAAHRFTDHEGLKGWAFLALRLGLYAWFLVAARATADAGGLKVRTFLGQFRLAASLYFLAYPVAFFVVPVFAAYLRRPLMEFGLMAAQVCSSMWLASLFLDRGAYFEASSLGASPLPGGGGSSPPAFFKTD